MAVDRAPIFERVPGESQDLRKNGAGNVRDLRYTRIYRRKRATSLASGSPNRAADPTTDWVLCAVLIRHFSSTCVHRSPLPSCPKWRRALLERPRGYQIVFRPRVVLLIWNCNRVLKIGMCPEPERCEDALVASN